MTPLQLTMLLHYYSIAEPYALRQPEHANSPVVKDQRMGLMNEGLLLVSDITGSEYKVTEKGKAFIEALCNMPLPVCKWVIPSKDDVE